MQTYSIGYLLENGSAVFLVRDKVSDLHLLTFKRETKAIDILHTIGPFNSRDDINSQ